MNVYDLSKLSIVIADESRDMRDLTSAILTGLHIPYPYCAGDGEAAMRIVADAEPDLVITDWEMSPMSGIELVRALRDEFNSPDPTIPIIMMTGHSARERVLAARDAGANEFVAKPMTVDSIYKRLVNLIERPRPFVRVNSYFGPDRRRKIEDFAGEDKRRIAPDLVHVPGRAA